MKAIILAGGKGTRLKQLSKHIPKPLLKVAEKCVIDYSLDCCEQSNYIDNVYIITHHFSTQFENHINNVNHNLNINCIKEKKPLGTAGALHSMPLDSNEDIVIFYADIVCYFDVDHCINFHYKKKAIATLVVHPNDHPYDSDIIIANSQQKITSISSKPHDHSAFLPNCVNAGCYVLNSAILKEIPKEISSDFGRDILPKYVKKEPCYAYHTTEYLKDMGTPTRLQQVEADILSKKVVNLHRKNKRPAVFLDRDGVINVEQSYITSPDMLTLYSVTPKAISILNKLGFLVIVITNQAAIARNLMTLQELKNIHNKLETLLGHEGAFLDAIFYCPHHPDKGFKGENKMFKKDCNCRKPKTGMIQDAMKTFNIDLQKSYLIGDSARDIECGKTVGVHTIGVRTGHGVKGDIIPDTMCKDILDAVMYIKKKDYS